MDDGAAKRPNIAHYKTLKECKTLQDAFETHEMRDLLKNAIPESLRIPPEAMLRTFINTANQSPNIYKCDLRPAIGKFMTLAYLGLRPGPDLGLAHLIPFERTKYDRATKTRVHDGYDLQLIIGYQGYVDLAFRSGFVKDVATGVVYPGDQFDFERGSERFLRHRPNLDTDNSSVTPRACWAMFKFTNQGEEFDVMSWSEIERIRNRSQAYRRALAAKLDAEEKKYRIPVTWTEAPWVRDQAEMGRKTVLRRLSKLIPRCPELRFATNFEDAQERGSDMDWSPIIEGTSNPIEDGIVERPGREDQDDGPAGDPGATFTDRRESRQTQEQTRPESQADSRPPIRESENPVPDDAREDGFGPAVIYDAFGTEESDKEYLDPQEFARRIVTLWTSYSDADRAAFLEYNEAWIEEARVYAGEILAKLDQDAEQPVAAVEVPMARGNKPSWTGYFRDLEAAGAATPTPLAERWVEAQKTIVLGLPFAQIRQAVARLTAVCGRAKIGLPRWAYDAINPESEQKPTQEHPGNGEAETSAEPGVDSGDARDATTTAQPADPDADWVTRRIKGLESIRAMRPLETARKAYAELMEPTPVVDKLTTMQQRNRPQWQRLADEAAKTREAIGMPHMRDGQE